MAEVFRANAGEIAGMGNLMEEIGKDAWLAADFIHREGPPAEWVNAEIIDSLLDPLRSFSEKTRMRMLGIGTTNADSALSLRDAAWLYVDQDNRTYEALNRQKVNLVVPGQQVPVLADQEVAGATNAFEGAAAYPKPEKVQLDPPAANKEELIGLIGDVAPPLGAVNDTVKRLTKAAGKEFDPLGEALKPVPGNWTEIRRIGEAYKIAGQALEACGKNLESGAKRVDAHWDGQAALAFSDWAARQVAAMKWEGPTGRIISEGLGAVSDEIRNAVRKVLTWLWEMLESQVTIDGVTDAFKFAFKKIPVVGWGAQVAELAIKIKDIIEKAVNLVGEIRKLVDAVQKFLDVLSDPAQFMRNQANQKFEQLVEPFAKGVKAADIMNDARLAADLSQTTNRPGEAWDVGTGQQPWANG
ncbi:hypothetical protein [Nocardia carnea]|uniref:hypothetical protein n=1 Tax=Nocardia carnea TaxID=37328 RepID=UPI00245566EC|nr:hypothetical protein [Nocardia carnea]